MAAGDVTRLVAAGDWFARGRFPEAVRSRRETAALFEELRAADVAFVNLETPLTTRGVPTEKLTVLRADPALAEDLVDAGVDIACLANNHMLDYGPIGLEDTLATLARRGIQQVGGGPNLDAARSATVVDGPGGSIGFLAFAATLPQGFAAGNMRPGIAPIHIFEALVVEKFARDQPGAPPPMMTFAAKPDLEATVEAVRALRQRADYVIVSAHWGVSGQDAQMDYQPEIGRALIDAGADMILGHHPHRLHGVEFYHGKPIMYSIGNFAFEPLTPSGNSAYLSFRSRRTAASVYGAMRRESAMVEARIRGDRLERLSLLPILVDGDGYPSVRRDAAEATAALLSGLSRSLGAAFQAEDGRVIVSPE